MGSPFAQPRHFAHTMRHWPVKWVENDKGRENRESEISLAQTLMKGNDSGVLQQLFDSQVNVTQDRAQKAGTKSLAGMNWNRSDPSVLMPEKNVAATRSNHLKTDSSESLYDLLALQPGKAGHTEICWIPTSSSGPASPRSSSRHSSIASRARYMSVSRFFAWVWQPRSPGTVAT
jgi:hypothetical protein